MTPVVPASWPTFSALLKLAAALAVLAWFAGCAAQQKGPATCLSAPELIAEVQSCGTETTTGNACYACQGDAYCLNPGTLDYCVERCGDPVCPIKSKARR